MTSASAIRRRRSRSAIEQAVYGSFPFWDRGYAVLAQSPGCRPEWLAELRAACQRFGERPGGRRRGRPGCSRSGCRAGPWVIVGVGSPGSDDRGGPGRWRSTRLFLSPRDYRKAGVRPVRPRRGACGTTGRPRRATCPPGRLDDRASGPPAEPTRPIPAPRRIAAALARGRRVALEAAAPIDDLARQVWHALARAGSARRASVATWAFGNGNRFDLVALPRLAGVALDASYVATSTLEAGGVDGGATVRFSLRMMAATGPPSLLALAAVGLALWGDVDDVDDTDAPRRPRSRPREPFRSRPRRRSLPRYPSLTIATTTPANLGA